MFQIPILFICYKRHEYVDLVFNKIKQLNPANLYISIDGPRSDEDISDIDKVKEIVSNYGNTKYLIRDKNIGCERNVLESIDWILSEQKEVIVIEEDIYFDERFINFIVENKHFVESGEFCCISKLLYNSHQEDEYQFNAHGWYITKDSFVSTYENLDFYTNKDQLDKIIWNIYRPSQDSYKAVYNTLIMKAFHWDEHLKYNIYFKGKKVLYFPDEYTEHIGEISTNKELKYILINNKIVDMLPQ